MSEQEKQFSEEAIDTQDSINNADISQSVAEKSNEDEAKDISDVKDDAAYETEEADISSEDSESADTVPDVTKEDAEYVRTAEENTPINDKKKNKHQKKPKKDIFDIKKDIWYRGPISYRHLKILGWICLIIYQVAFVISIGNSMGMELDVGVLSDSTFTGNIHSMALPLMIVSIFAVLLSKRDSYKETIILYGVLAFGLSVLFLLFYYHYILGLFQPISSISLPLSVEMPGKDVAENFLTSALFKTEDFKGFFAFNIFIDLFLCTLLMFFMEYTPKRFFRGKKIVIFRALAILPILYEIASMFIKIMATNKLIEIPLWISPFLTTKPPMSVVMFFSLVRYIKKEKKNFLDTGRTEEEYSEYCKTNIHSFRFSKHLSLTILIYAALDMVLLVILSSVHLVLVDNITDMKYLSTSEGYLQMLKAMLTVWNWGIGNTVEMIELIPLVLLFSYTRTHKVKVIDKLIPIIGVVLIVLVYFEGVFQLVQSWIDYGLYELRYGIEHNSDNIAAIYFKIEEFFRQYGGYLP